MKNRDSVNKRKGKLNRMAFIRLREIRWIGIVLSILLGLVMEAVFYYIFSIEPAFVPNGIIIILWLANTLVVGCLVDEVIQKRYRIGII